MDSLQNGHPPLPASSAAGDRTGVIHPQSSNGLTTDDPQILPTSKRKIKKKKQAVVSDTASFDSSSNCSSAASYSQKGIKISRNPKRIRVGPVTTGRKSVGSSDVDALGLPLGMSIAAVVAQVLEKKNAAGEMSVDYLSAICGLAVRESLGNVFGDKFDNFVGNFETSFRSTLLTLQLISGSSQNDSEKHQRSRFGGCSCSVTSNVTSHNTHKDSPCPLEDTVITEQQQRVGYQDGAIEASSLTSHNTHKDSPCPLEDTVITEHQRVGYQDCTIEASSLTSHNMHKDSPCHLEETISTEQQQRVGYQDGTFEASSLTSHYPLGYLACCSGNTDGPVAFSDRSSTDRKGLTPSEMKQNVMNNLTSQQIVLHNEQIEKQLACAFQSNSSSNPIDQFSMLSTMGKSVMEQTRYNDLKTFEIGLIMKKLQLKEKQLELSSNSNILERWKISMGISKASFKSEKFKTQLQDSKQVELLKKCLDFLVGGLIIMLFSLAYGTYVYSHRRIIEATEACSPYTESSSWWMPKQVSSFNNGLHFLKCQFQVFSRMLFGVIMIAAIAFLLIQRSATSHQAMPVTVIMLLLGVGCGYAGKFCIYTLGGSGTHWLIYWEALCMLHFVCNIFHSTLFIILNGPVLVAEMIDHNPVFPYWVRKLVFFATLLFLPVLCGFMPFAGPWEWFQHFSSQAADFLTFEDD